MRTVIIADDDLACGKSILNSLEKLSKNIKVVRTSYRRRGNFRNGKSLTTQFSNFGFKNACQKWYWMLYHCINSFDSDSFDISNISIDNLLHEFHFNFSSKSYLYLIKCIEKALYRPLVLQNIYREIAIEEHTSEEKVKWRVEKLVSSMNRFTPTDTLKKYIPQYTNISPKMFIYTIVHILKNKTKSS